MTDLKTLRTLPQRTLLETFETFSATSVTTWTVAHGSPLTSPAQAMATLLVEIGWHPTWGCPGLCEAPERERSSITRLTARPATMTTETAPVAPLCLLSSLSPLPAALGEQQRLAQPMTFPWPLEHQQTWFVV